MADANTNLYFAYCTSTSWQTPIMLDYGGIDTSTMDIIYDYDNLLTPRFEFWGDTVYENTEYDYDIAQYYSESFTVYSASQASDYTHQFDMDDYSFENDFTNLQLFKVMALRPTMEEFEIIDDDIDYDFIFDIANKEIRIIVLAGEILTNFDLITVVLSHDYGPVSTFSEISLSQTFYDNYLTDAEATFYDYLSIFFDYSILSGEYLFDENSQTITSAATSFEYIPFNRNPEISTNNKLNSEDSEMYIGFELFYDPFNVIYEADLDMDGKKDYKQTIDVDKDGVVDIIKYGIEDPENADNIIWYTIIQDFYSEEVIVDKKIEEEKRTEWFDIDDKAFSDYEWNIILLIVSVLVLPLLLYTLSTMVLPDVDYWAQKSISQEIEETQYVKSHYYSIRIDEDRDGFTDTQVTYEKSTTVVKYKCIDYEKTIIAAKPQNVFTFLGEWIAKNVESLLGKLPEDRVFNDKLTEEKLDSGDLSYLNNDHTESILGATYRKFTKNTTVTYKSEYIDEKITVTDWVNGTIEQTRIYRDLFDNNNVNSDVVQSLSEATYTIEDTESGQTQVINIEDENPPITVPIEQQWDLDTWEENIPIRFDSTTTIYSDGSTTINNIYEETITIEIPGRFNLYDDLFSNNQDTAVQSSIFTVTGILITPYDGMVYSTSSKDLYKSGKAKTPGKYFYYDSNLDGFYETVYILEPNPVYYDFNALIHEPVYIVKAIAYNYDGDHDVSPYSKVVRKVISKTDFYQLAGPPQKFGEFWKVNFMKLKSIDLLFPCDPFDGYEPKDSIFEISKLVNPSIFNSKFSELFYESRHRAYDDAWEVYKDQLVRDIAEQVFMTLTASVISAALQWIPFVGSTLGTLAYIAVYTLLTKFSMDMKRHEAQAIERANTYIPVNSEDIKPISLNERSLATHGFWEDSMIAALMGHPNAYYTTIQGTVGNQLYTAQAIASPPNILRYADSGDTNEGFLNFLWDNLWEMEGSNPDLMVGLDFDNMNLDYFLMTTELPSLNDNLDYTFSASINDGLYYTYRENTIGYLQQAIMDETDGELSLIKPIIIDGRPEYIFVDGTDGFNLLTMPASHLYQPLVVSSEVAEDLQLEGQITVNIKCAYSSNTKGILHHSSYPERESYPSKVPLSTHGFEYPITSVKIELIEETITGNKRTVDSITYTSDSAGFKNLFHTELGNMYIAQDLDTILFANQNEFNALIDSGQMAIGTKKYYRLTLKFDMIVADSNSEVHNRMALTQASSYAIMDYMNQYTFAKTTADMIAEIAYTESLTVISSIISATAILLGSWAVIGLKSLFTETSKITVKSALRAIGLGAAQLATGVIVGSVKEMFEEIIVDGFLETWGEKFIMMNGGNEEIAFWFTSLLTSGREGVSGLRSTIMKTFGKHTKTGRRIVDIRTKLSTWLAVNPNSNNQLRNEIIEQVNEMNAEQDGKKAQQIDKIKSWKQIIGAGLLGIITTVVPAMFTGGLFLGNFFSTMGIVSKIEGITGDILGRYGTMLNIDKMARGDGKNLQAYNELLRLNIRKTKSGIDSSQINREYTKDNGEHITPVDISVIFNPDFMKEDRPSRLKEEFDLTSSDVSSISDYESQAKISQVESQLMDKKSRAKKNLIELNKLVMSHISRQGLIAAGSPNIVEISLEGLSLPEQAQFNEEVEGYLGSWENDYVGKGVTFRFTIDSSKVSLTGVLEIVRRSFGIDAKKVLRFWMPNYGILYEGKTIPARRDGDEDIIITESTKFSDIEVYPGLTIVFDLSSLKLFENYQYFKSFKSNHAYKLGGDIVIDQIASNEDKVQVLDYLAAFTNRLANKLLSQINLKDRTGFNFENLITQSKFFHDSLYLNKEIKDLITSGNKEIDRVRWRNWKITSNKKYELSMLTDLLNSKDTYISYLVRSAEDLIFELIFRDNLHLYKTFEEGDYQLDSIVSMVDGFLSNKDSRQALINLVLGPKGISLFWNKFVEAFFDSTRHNKLTLRRDIWTYHGRIGEAIVYTGEKIHELVEAFIDNNYQPLEIIDATNFGVGSPELGNVYIQKFGTTIREVSNKIYGLNLDRVSSALLKNRRFYDGELAITDSGYYGGPTKHSIDSRGLSSKQIIQSVSDAASIHIDTVYFEIARGISQLVGIKDLHLTFNGPPKGGDPSITLSSLINTWNSKHRFSDFGKGTDLKMPSGPTFASVIIDVLNSDNDLYTQLKNVPSESLAIEKVRNYLSNDKKISQLEEIFKNKAKDCYTSDRFLDIWLKYDLFTATIDFIRNNINSLISEDSRHGGYTLSLRENLDLLFIDQNGESVNFNDLPEAFTIVEGEKVPFTLTLFNKFKAEKKPLFIVHDIDGKFGVIAAEIFTDMNALERIGVFPGYKHNGEGKYKDQIFQNVFIGDCDYVRLHGKVEIMNGQIQVRNEGWQNQFSKCEVNIPQKTFYAPFTLVTGSQLFLFLQKVHGKFNAFDYHQRLLPEVKRKSLSFTESLLRPEAKDFDQLSVNAIKRVNIINNFLLQLDQMYSKTRTELSIGDKFLQVNYRSYRLDDGSEVFYTINHIQEVISKLAPSSEQLKQITLYIINPVTGKIEINNIGDKSFKKEFYRTWLALIKNNLGDNLFKKYSFLSDKIFSLDTSKLVVDNDFNDEQLVDLLNMVLEETFGLPALTLLKTGLMTFTNEYKVSFDKHKQRTLGKIISSFNIRPLKYSAFWGTQFGTEQIAPTYIPSNDIKEVFASFIISGYDELFTVFKNNEITIERFITHTDPAKLGDIFDNTPDIYIDSPRYHNYLAAEYIQGLYYNEYSVNEGTRYLTYLKDILSDILEKKLEHFDIDDVILDNLNLPHDNERELILLKQQIKLAMLQQLFTFQSKEIDSSLRLKLRDYLTSQGTKTVTLDFFIDGLFHENVKEIIRPWCKLTLDFSLYEEFALYSTEISSFLDYDHKVYSLSSAVQTQNDWLIHNKVLNTHKADMIKIASFLKYMVKAYGPLRIYGFRMGKTGLSAPDMAGPAYYPEIMDNNLVDVDFTATRGTANRRAFFLEYDESTGGFKNFNEDDFMIFIGALILDRQTMIVRTEQMTNEYLSKNKILFTFNFWQERISPRDIVGSSSHGPKPIGPNEVFTSADGILGIPSGAYEDLLTKWALFMKSKQINLLYRFSKFSDWRLFWEQVSYLNQDIANLGDPSKV